MQFQTMSSQGALSSVFRLALKILRSTFKHLYLFELQVQVVYKGDSHVSFVCVCVTLQRVFSQKKKKKSGVVIVCSG